MRVRSFFFLLFVLSLFSLPVSANQQDTRTQLQRIRQQIEKAQNELTKKNKTEVKLNHELALLQQTLKRIDARIVSLRTEQQQLQRQIEQQQKNIQAGKGTIQTTGNRLKRRLVALYKEGEVGPLKILFSAESPTELVQQFQYLTRILHYDKGLLEEYRMALNEQQLKLSELETLQQKKRQLLTVEEAQQKDAKEGRQLQVRLLKQVQGDKEAITGNLAELQEKAKRLQTLITELEQQAKRELPQQVTAGASDFNSGKGKLNWPVGGQVLIGFGTKKDPEIGTLYESNGFEIATRDNEPILAVADGRVAFSDWFKGYGNLLILSHPGGYHTLYAQAAKLERSIGDQVKAGQLLGYSGLNGRKSIYFEIRQNGAAVDPNIWLKRR